MSTLGNAITVARGLLQDTGFAGSTAISFRYADADLLQYGWDALTIMAEFRPELFTVSANHTCAAGTQQTLTLPYSLGLVECIGNEVGYAMRKFDLKTMDGFRPNWANDTPGPGREWGPQKASKYIFYVYPPAVAGKVISVLHVYNPRYTQTQAMDTRLDSYEGTIADYIAGKAEARESESTGPQREQSFEQSFIAKIKGKQQ